MGEVRVSFKANADGSFYAGFTLSSLNVRDEATIGSLFPLVVRSMEQSNSKTNTNSTISNAIEFQLRKSRLGDQDLVVKMVAYELVASFSLFKDLKKFFSFQEIESETMAPFKLYPPVNSILPIIKANRSPSVTHTVLSDKFSSA